MKRLLEGVRKFQRVALPQRVERFEKLSHGQAPLALFITCSDSRIDPALLTQTEPGELFVIRNAGNIVPAYDDARGGEAATVEYALEALDVANIIVCGHSKCGAMTGLLEPDSVEPLPAVASWLEHAQPAIPLAEERRRPGDDPDRSLVSLVEANVLLQLEHLKTHPSVQKALERENLHLHGWVYEFESGCVFVHNPDTQQFDAYTPDKRPL